MKAKLLVLSALLSIASIQHVQAISIRTHSSTYNRMRAHTAIRDEEEEEN